MAPRRGLYFIFNPFCLIYITREGISIHTGHRERLKKRFKAAAPETFEDYQLLELLLFYSIPRSDTNPPAHTLLEKFGSLRELLDADMADIKLIDGIGENSAMLIRLVSELSRRYFLHDKRQSFKITSIDSAEKYIRGYFTGRHYEEFYVFCVDAQYRIKSADKISTGTTKETAVYIRHIAQSVIRSGTEKILVAHNHPGGKASPSKNDIETTLRIKNAMDALSIDFLDHIIVGENDYFSFAAELQLDRGISQDEARAAQYSGGVMQSITPDFYPKKL